MGLMKNEIAELEDLQKRGFKHLARDENGKLYAYINDAKKRPFRWVTDDYTFDRVDSTLCKFITWEDEEPRLIEDLLKGVD